MISGKSVPGCALEWIAKRMSDEDAAAILARNIEFLASRENYSKSGLAAYLGVHRSKITEYAKGEVWPNPSRFVRIAKYFGVKPKDLLDDDLPATLANTQKSISVDQALSVVSDALGYTIKPKPTTK